MYRKRLAALALGLLAATAAHAGPYDRFIGMSLKSATSEAERQGFVYVRPLDIAGNNESFLWQRGPTCVLVRSTDHVVVSVSERPGGECNASSSGRPGHDGGGPGRNEVIDICKKAVARRGYERFDDIDADQQRGGGWNVSGKARGDRGRITFDCSTDGRSVRKLVVESVGGGRDDDVVACESENRGYKRCEMDTRRGVRLVERISETRCVEGQNWGVRYGAVWVDKGCAAKFRSAGR